MQKTLTALLGGAIAIIVLPLFAAQSLSASIASSFGMAENATGVIAMMPMLGYATGLVFVVPLIDIHGIRPTILTTLLAGTAALAGAACAPSGPLFLLSAFVVGVATSAIQMVVPLVATLAHETERGRTIGRVMSALMIGVLLSRPTASLSAEWAGWRGTYVAEGAALGIVWLAFLFALPRRAACSGLSYVKLVRSLWTVLREEAVLRRRAACQALCMGAFGAFWTAVPLLLAAPPFELDQIGIAAFAFAGIGGAIAAPVAGWAADRSWAEPASRIAHALVIIGSVLALIVGAGWLGFEPGATLALLVLAAVVLDLGVIGDQTLGRHAVNSLRPEIRGRLNGLYTGLFFVGGAFGAALAGIVWASGGWAAICTLGICFGALALLLGAASASC